VAIVRWTSDNPGGSPEHYAVAHFGMNPHDLNQTAESPIRLNLDNRYTVFRVRIDDLRPQTTYDYRVQSMDSTGTTNGGKSPLRSFRTP
jgi:Purple acid Phosphatase, N-terminal domain